MDIYLKWLSDESIYGRVMKWLQVDICSKWWNTKDEQLWQSYEMLNESQAEYTHTRADTRPPGHTYNVFVFECDVSMPVNLFRLPVVKLLNGFSLALQFLLFDVPTGTAIE